MSWAGLAFNQTISFNNLQDAVNTGQFTALGAIPVSNEQITKTDASNLVNVYTGYAPFANKASNQLVVKDDLITTTTTTTTTSTTTTTTTSAPSTVTINWDVRKVGSGAVRLVIYDSTATIILDEESQGSGIINGSITTSNTPFTVAVSRAAGTEVAQFRICNVSVGAEITHNYNVTSEVTYVVDPTPLTTSVFATYGDSNTPVVCPID